jgi:hypothetical protein
MFISALGASLGSVTRINGNNLPTRFCCLVAQKSSELGERPGVQAALLCSLARFHSLANIGQILNHYRGARRTAINNAATQKVVAVSVESHPLVAYLTQVAFSGFCSFRLERTNQAEIASVN